MKVTQNTADTLVIDHVPWLLSIGLVLLILLFVGIGLIPLGSDLGPMSWLFSFMFIGVGGGLWLMALELFAKRLQFIFDRQANRISIRRRSVFSRKEVTFRLSRLVETRIEQSMSDSGQPMSRPVLILHSTSKGAATTRTVPLHHYYTNGQGPETIVETINAWWLTDT
ncbi:MAG: hypothetical protein AB8B82_12710 [Roseovarius sp.]